jgi:hypothetical protein
MKHHIIEIFPDKYRIYDRDNDFVLPRNFLNVQKANDYIIHKLNDKTKKIQFHTIHTIMGFN